MNAAQSLAALGLWLTLSGCARDPEVAPRDAAPAADVGPDAVADAAIDAPAIGDVVAPDDRVDGGRCAARFTDDFEDRAAGAALGARWVTEIDGDHSFVRASEAAEGLGNAGSSRFLILLNAGFTRQVTLTAATAPIDLDGCAAARVELSVIAFSMEAGEGDRAWIEARVGGGAWTQLAQVFPSASFHEDKNCRQGTQATGCTMWVPLAFDLPEALRGAGFQVRARVLSFTDHSDAIGLDDVRITGR
jgi:hypothetical protein